jgi:hypothetical protein
MKAFVILFIGFLALSGCAIYADPGPYPILPPPYWHHPCHWGRC